MKNIIKIAIGLVLVFMGSQSSAQNARVSALGVPSTGLTLLIDDVSDVLNYPSEVVTNADLVQGAVGLGNTSFASFVSTTSPGYVYASKSFMDNMALGIVFGQPSYLTGHYIPGGSFGNTGYVTFNSALSSAYGALPGAFGLTAPGVPANSGHLLFGMSLGDNLSFGLDLFREAANSTSESDATSLTIPGAKIDVSSKTGALGVIVGANSSMGDMGLKISTGFVSPSHSSKASQTLAGAVSEATLEKESGIYFPLSAKASMAMDDHKFVVGLDFVMNGYKFKGTSSAGPVPVQSEYSNTHMALGIGDEIKIASNTTFFASFSYIQSSTTIKIPAVAPASKGNDVTTTGTALPRMSIGLEQSLNNFWKTDKITLRAGGLKALGWSSTEASGDNSAIQSSKTSGVAIPSTLLWTTGLSVTKGAFDLDVVVDPTRWNGVHFIGSGAGPVGVNITMTYNFGEGGSSSSSSSAPRSFTPSPSPSSAPASSPAGGESEYGF